MSDIAVVQLIEQYKATVPTNTSLTVSEVMVLLQKAVAGIVGSLLTNKFGFDPNAIETTAIAYVEQFYSAVIKPLEIANLPGGALSEAVLHSFFTSAANAAVHTLVQLVFHTRTTTASGPGATPTDIAVTMQTLGQPT